MIRLFGFVWISLLWSGCVHLDESIQIDQNGSAKIIISYSVPMKVMTLLKDSEAVLADLDGRTEVGLLPRIFDEKKLRQHFSSYKGIDIISVRVNEKDDRIVTYINIHVSDLRSSLREGLVPYTSLEKEKDNYVFAARYPFNLSKLQGDKKLFTVLKEMNISFKVKTPTTITETNGTKESVNLAVWNFSPENVPFTQSDGRFIVKFSSTRLSFLDEQKAD